MSSILKKIIVQTFRLISRFSFDHKSIVVYDSTFGYAGHSKAVYDFLSKYYEKRRIYFVTKRHDGFGLNLFSVIGVYVLLTKRNYCLTASMPSFIDAKYKKVFQFWHGTPIKHMGVFDNSTTNYQKKRICEEFSQYDKIAYSDEVFLGMLKKSYNVADLSVIVNCYTPYLIGLISARTAHESSKAERDRGGDRSLVIGYIPTYRNFASRDWDLLESSDFTTWMSSNGVQFLHRYHPSDSRYNRNSIAVEDVLVKADIVISDYSSVLFDAKKMGVKTVSYIPDAEEYGISRGVSLELINNNFAIASDIPTLISILSNDSKSLGIDFDEISIKSSLDHLKLSLEDLYGAQR